MSRLPIPNGDNDQWGTILNDYLNQAHDADGSIKPIAQSKVINLSGDLNAKASVTDLAAKANTADLALVATSGSYADLSNKPTIPTTTDTMVGPGVRLYNPLGLRRWATALADAQLGTASITVMGDSISVGAGSDGVATSTNGADATYRTSGWVPQLRSLFAGTYGDTGEGFIGSLDNGLRVTYSGGAGGNYGIGPYKNGSRASVGQSITYAMSACTQIEMWIWDGGGGTATYTIDGGSAVNFSAGTGVSTALTWTKTTITGLSNATHTFVINGPASGNVYVSCLIAIKQTTGVRVHRLALSGNTTNNLLGFDSNLNGQAAAQARVLLATAKVPVADLLVIALGVNDFGGQNNTLPTVLQPGSIPSRYASNLQTVVAQAVTNGACVLLLGEPRQNAANYPSPLTYVEQDYWDQARSLAQSTDHCAFMDVGDLWGTNPQGQTLSLYTSGSVHPTRKGHGSMARLVYQALTGSYGFNAPAS